MYKEGASYELAARKNSIYASITKDEFEELDTTLMDVVSTTHIFQEAHNDTLTFSGRDAAINVGKSFGLTDEETLAVMIYTTEYVYAEFNRILREGDIAKYDKSFQVFHYLLINAIEKIRQKQTLPEYLYRGDEKIYSIEYGTDMRFPGYTSTSSDEFVAEEFRGSTGTLIHLEGVKFGADIASLSVVPSEAEVLIPPYESFKVTNVDRDDTGPLIYLQSIGEMCGGRRRRSRRGPCQCCRQPLDVIRESATECIPQQMRWDVVYVGLVVFVVVRLILENLTVQAQSHFIHLFIWPFTWFQKLIDRS
ncbi:NAD(P)(+)--arginine ADP-ribosyltransferase 2-like [Haliotis rubra]|uniref:NAD(P)(+)--arginine ADP-ribosyltransferase 2-like n=1 Tax=Haliotis rubra TaxID=36100 RepID=UPI001EE5937A|nr:NAD(P)(+)--arginine ADP-ribosyltransferase 2-like [Haliotis rubra]